jgi:hypothetical protein
MSGRVKRMQVIINADDFGMCPVVNHGVLECYNAGGITSTTMIVNRQATSEEAAAIAQKCPGLGVGLHFNLTSGRPISCLCGATGLVDSDGNFFKSMELKRHWILGRLKREAIALELQAQFEMFLSLGLYPTHIDSHDHIHILPVINDVVSDFCIRQNLSMRTPRWNYHQKGNPLKTGFVKMVFKIIQKRNFAKWKGRIRTNYSFVSIQELNKSPDEVIMKDYLKLLHSVRKGPIELMVHPAAIDNENGAKILSRFSQIKKAELKIFSQPAFRKMLIDEGFKLTTFAEI